MRCVGVYEVDQGRCIDVDKDDQSFEECSEDGLCSSGSGLVCAMGFLCNPGWMQGRFVGEPNLPIPDANFSGADATVLAYGLSTVSTDVSLDLHITHERPSDLIVSVLNPEGTEVIVFDRDDVAGEIRFKSLSVLGFPGDESANGNWTIRAIDTKTGSTGVIQSFALTIMSRWD
jgi:subtilisin-like proprotein convertase family protein